jgi:hypothetical protein
VEGAGARTAARLAAKLAPLRLFRHVVKKFQTREHFARTHPNPKSQSLRHVASNFAAPVNAP